MSSLANDAGILRKPRRVGVPAVGRNSPFAHVVGAGSTATVKASTRRLKTVAPAATFGLVDALAPRIGRLDRRVA
jgi:hypothetical protein